MLQAEQVLDAAQHPDHIHVGFSPQGGVAAAAADSPPLGVALGSDRWNVLLARLRQIPEPTVLPDRSHAAVPDGTTGPADALG